jgi:hypothetical protein
VAEVAFPHSVKPVRLPYGYRTASASVRTGVGARIPSVEVPDLTPGPSLRPRIRRVHPVNLSILMTGGKETNQDVSSNGE